MDSSLITGSGSSSSLFTKPAMAPSRNASTMGCSRLPVSRSNPGTVASLGYLCRDAMLGSRDR